MRTKETESDIKYLPGVGPKRAELLQKELGIRTFGDLIHFYPFRYIDRSTVIPISSAMPDMAHIQIRARVISRELYGLKGAIYQDNTGTGAVTGSTSSDAASDAASAIPSSRTGQPAGKDLQFPQNLKPASVKRLRVLVQDGTGIMEAVFFKGIKWTFEKLVPGKEFIFFGKPSVFNGRLNLVHPDIDDATGQASPAGTLPALTGIYPSTEKLKNAGLTAKTMNKMQAAALQMSLPDIEETLPDYLIRQKGLVSIHFALRNIHFPSSQEALAKAKYRLKFEELFYLQLSLLKQKYIRSRNEVGIRMPKVGDAFNACYNSLPFPLTGAQKRVITEIRDDMRSGHQLNRLLQGDVGSGKTMVAVLTALIAVGNGYQACIMAPTEVLAQQHFKNISKYLAPTGVKAALLTGSSRTAERREVHAGLEDGSIGIIVGTHALLEDNVVFRNLGLAVIDEQHRFGVEQRARLWKKSSCGIPPHILVMTATPIPRTLAMTLYGDLDVSVIDELPPGRKPVQTIHATEGKRLALFKFMRDQIALGRQVFVVYPLIFESEKMDYKNLEQGYEQIVHAFPFPPYKTAIVHGQQSNEDKKFNMDAFAAGRADILVATSVIEVGVDVPNASVMVIESAERFGLSQLHQLRGRVGRGSEKSYCILMTGNKLSKESKQRIDLMCATENGFELAEEDMKMRGPGDLEGTQQSGLPINLRIASLAKDGLILNDARSCAQAVLEEDPMLSSDKNMLLREELRKDKYVIRDFSKIS
ncbi:MAG: ATP-dependent DNA helicase RecG [Bacteroidetes bacterium]|uniref:ATP-dependent DNA helicase RecG n=1 Tax=Candidatus Cryptobacteroides intestinigallinarum TaxID=2840767 RepID=A0A9D9HKK2_9BACT|nr:ATP-dependent DNA helicase RecG [Candidatus Cryptobacteroides intestinigallinarum]